MIKLVTAQKIKEDTLKMLITVEMTYRKILDQFIAAFESSCGSHYWAQGVTYTGSPKPDPNKIWYDDINLMSWRGWKFEIRYDVPELPEGNGKGKKTINLTAVQLGLGVMAQKHPRHFAEMLNEDGDASTADVLLQCIVFGDTIYG